MTWLGDVLAVVVPLATMAFVARLCELDKPTLNRATHRSLRRIRVACDALRAANEQEAAFHLVGLLRVSAVAISDEHGNLKAWDGACHLRHYPEVDGIMTAALLTGDIQRLAPDALRCPDRRCAMRTAVSVPLLVEGEVKAVVTVCARTLSEHRLRIVRAVTAMLTAHLQIARLDVYKEDLAAAEVRAHRAQISPHFVYNALAAIASMIRTDPEHARVLVGEFADFIEYSFFRKHGQFGTLLDELGSIDHYLTLEQARFGARLTVTLAIAPEVLPVVIPFLSLQPLVENAVQHGMDRAKGTCHVTITAQDNGPEVIITVEDQGPGMDPDRLAVAFQSADGFGDGIALRNINDRLRRVYGGEYGLIVDTGPGAGTKVVMKVPKFRVGVHPPLPVYSSRPENALRDV